MKKFLLALLTAATAAALLCGAAAVSTYSVGYDAPAGIITIVVQDSSCLLYTSCPQKFRQTDP